jgi:hypothetical protein
VFPGSAHAKECLDPETAGSADLSNRKEADSKTDSAQEAQKKERVARCKPQADHLAQIQKEILAIQQ